ncbi:LacI family DNA-binding transcriptional regulator [Bifidobacterium simiarum]|nr:LacI family DNA-binding transcriptional regulator [Bifidobacterium simiarum]
MTTQMTDRRRKKARNAAVRLQDVAELAGVSVKTVSNVVRDQPNVRDETRKRVQRAIDELGYVPNVTARRLATGRTGMVELALPDIRAPYYAELADRMFDEAKKHGLRLLIEQTRGDLDSERGTLVSPQQGLVDGIIFEPVSMSTTQIALLQSRTPIVMLGDVTPPMSVDHVGVDNVAAAQTATTHLVERGCRRIAYLSNQDPNLINTERQRLLGYETALRNAGREPDASLYVPVTVPDADGASRAIEDVLADGLRFDGLFCYNDMFAIGALRALRRAGLRVPDDVAIVGWNDILMAQYTNPSLTTIAPDIKGLCENALTMLNSRIDGYQGIGRHVDVDYRLVVRESTAHDA